MEQRGEIGTQQMEILSFRLLFRPSRRKGFIYYDLKEVELDQLINLINYWPGSVYEESGSVNRFFI